MKTALVLGATLGCAQAFVPQMNGASCLPLVIDIHACCCIGLGWV
jgi:hypothetical protein